MNCIISTSFSTMVEGSLTEFFLAQWGVGQGDSLSPLLFVLAIEYLTRLLKNAFMDGSLELYLNKGVAVEPLLTYVDDITIFCCTSRKSMSKINLVLE